LETRPNIPTQIKAEALQTVLEQVQAGASLEDALQPYGRLADELRPLAEIALANRAYAASLTAPQNSQAASRAQFLNAAHTYAESKFRRRWVWNAFPRLALAAVVFLAVLILGGFSSMAASAQSLPGDWLYPVKIASEQTRLWLTSSPNERLTLEKSYDQRRADEIVELIKENRSAIVRLAGEVSAIEPQAWIVRDTNVLVNEETDLDQYISIGFYVEVTGWLQTDASLLAQSIRTRQINLVGTVDDINQMLWVIDGLNIQVNGNTLWYGSPTLGSRVEVQAYVLADGSLLAGSIRVTGAEQAGETWTAVPTQALSPLPSSTAQPSELQESEQENTQSGESDDDEDDNDGDDDDDEEDDDDEDDKEEDSSSGKSPTNTPEPGSEDESDD
jgi:hypothetical protein